MKLFSGLLLLGLNLLRSNAQLLDAKFLQSTVLEGKQLTFVAVLPKRGCSACEKAVKEVTNVQSIVKGIIPFLIANDEELMDMIDPDSTIPRDQPSVVVFRDGKLSNKKPADMSAPIILQFVMDEVQDVLMSRMGIPSTKSKDEKKTKTKSSTKTADKSETDQDVIELTQTTFKKHLMNDPDSVWFVKFYAPWCGHCKALAPTWKELGKSLKGKVKVAQVDATVHKQLASDFNIQGFPTLLLFPGGKKSVSKAVTYPGARDLAALRQFAMKHASSAVKPIQLLGQEQFDELCALDLCMISFLPHILDSSAKERKGYLKVLKQVMLQDSGLPMKYLWTEASNSLDLERALRLEFGWPAVILVSKSKGFYSTYRGGYKKEELLKFVNSVATGRVSGDPLPANLPAWPKAVLWDGRDVSRSEEL